MIDAKLRDAWLHLVAEAMCGTSTAQEAIRSLTERPLPQEELSRWMVRFLAPGDAVAAPQAFDAWLEESWKVLGLVPRSRYLEALERCEHLRARLEEAERTIQRLRAMVGVHGYEEELQQLLDVWSTSLEQTLKAQTEWMRGRGTAKNETGE